MYSLDEVAKEQQLFSDSQDDKFEVSDKAKKLIDFYMDFFSLLTI